MKIHFTKDLHQQLLEQAIKEDKALYRWITERLESALESATNIENAPQRPERD